MYTDEFLSNLEYFGEYDKDYVLDGLTKAVSRVHTEQYIKNLMDNKIPFCLAIFDIDNFKLINDSYGHLVGDEILKTVSAKLIEITMGRALVGRFGGDEFFVVIRENGSYDDTWTFLKDIFVATFRYNIKVNDDVNVLVTATCGCASYPKDRDNYSDLFTCADKALYRGKQKGRNCFIIYLEDKHSHIDVTESTQPLPFILEECYNLLNDNVNKFNDGLKKVFRFINNSLSLSGMCFLNNNEIIMGLSRDQSSITEIENSHFEKALAGKSYVTFNTYSDLKNIDPEFHKYAWDNDIKSLSIFKVEQFDNVYGYLLITDCSIKRIWQHSDRAILLFISKLMGMYLYTKDLK